MSKVRGPEQKIDFETLLPLPLQFWPGSVGTEHEKTFPGTHLDAAREVWGTKWNAYGLDEGKYESVVVGDGFITLTFKTANSPPMGWIMALFNTLKGRMILTWLNEGCAEAVVDAFDYSKIEDWGGSAWDRQTAPEDETRRLRKLYWGVERFKDEDAR